MLKAAILRSRWIRGRIILITQEVRQQYLVSFTCTTQSEHERVDVTVCRCRDSVNEDYKILLAIYAIDKIIHGYNFNMPTDKTKVIPYCGKQTIRGKPVLDNCVTGQVKVFNSLRYDVIFRTPKERYEENFIETLLKSALLKLLWNSVCSYSV